MKNVLKALTTAMAITGALSACSNKDFTQNQTSSSFQGIPELFNESSNIIGGTEVAPSDTVAPYIVGIYDLSKGGLCTGSIISSNVILTAAHCIGSDPTKMVLIFGSKLKQSQVYRKIDFAGAHSKYNPTNNEETDWNDIGIIHMQGTLPKGFKPAEMLSVVYQLQSGDQTLLAGYGLADGVNHTGSGVLREVTAPIFNPKFMEGQVIIDQRNGMGACHGDSGGPAYVNTSTGLKLWGVTSRGYHDKNNDCSQFAVYTNSLAYSQWITDAKSYFNLQFAPTSVQPQEGATTKALTLKMIRQKQQLLSQMKAKLFLDTKKLSY